MPIHFQDEEYKLPGEGPVDKVLRHFQENGHVPDCMTWSDPKKPELHRYVRQYDPDTKKEVLQKEPYHPRPFNRPAELGKSRQFVPEEDRSKFYDKPRPNGEDGVADAMIWWPTTLNVQNKNSAIPAGKNPSEKDKGKDHHDGHSHGGHDQHGHNHDDHDSHHEDHDHGHGKGGHHHGDKKDKHCECACHEQHGRHPDCHGNGRKGDEGHHGHGSHGDHHGHGHDHQGDHHDNHGHDHHGHDHHGDHHESHKENVNGANKSKDLTLEKRYYGVPPSPEAVRRNRDKPQSAPGKRDPLGSGIIISGPQIKLNQH